MTKLRLTINNTCNWKYNFSLKIHIRVTCSRIKPKKPRQWKKHAHPQRVVYCAIYLTLTRITKFAYCYPLICRLYVALTYSTRETIPLHYFPLRETSLGLGTTWVRQLRPGSCHHPTAATTVTCSRIKPQKPRQWKSMLTHQGWFTALYT